MKELPYNRAAAVEYARLWAFRRNPAYLNFDNLGGDCTNYASQCLFAGSRTMNPKRVTGWYYYSSSNRTASWTGVEYLYNFLINNKGAGPYAVLADKSSMQPGDIVQLGNSGGFYHSPVVVANNSGAIFVAAHTFDAYMRPLDSYEYADIRFLHIAGIRGF